MRDAYLETARRAIPAAKAFLPLKEKFSPGGRPLTINMHMAHGIQVTLPDRKMPLYERNRERYLAHFRAFADMVSAWIGDAPILVTVENTDGFKAYEQAAIELLLQRPCFGLTWDIGHSKAAGEGDMPFLLARKDRLCHMHVHDGTGTPPKNHLALGTGEIDLFSRLETAREASARCVPETKTVEALEHSVRRLKNTGML